VTLLESLLDAIVRLEGDALVMHVGEKPYVVTTSSSMNAYRGPLAWGQVELSSRVLTPEAVMSMVTQILPADQRRSLDDVGAIEHEIASPPGVDDRFTVVAARGGDDIWLELRRHQQEVTAAVASVEQTIPASQIAAAAGAALSAAVGIQEAPPGFTEPPVLTPLTPLTEEETDVPVDEVTIKQVTIEERVPVIDEVGQQVPERVEHIVIPVAQPQSPTGNDGFELVEAETQHAPTDADVDALLASAAAALVTSDRPLGQSGSTAMTPPEFVIVEEAEQGEAEEEPKTEAGADGGSAAQVGAEADVLDLTAALNELPVSTVSEPEPASTGSEQASTASEPEPALQALPELQQSPHAIIDVGGSEEPVFAVVEPAVPLFVEPPAPPIPPSAADVREDDAAAVSASTQDASQGESIVETPSSHAEVEKRRGVVVPMARTASKPETPPAGAPVTDAGLLEVLKAASERGASIVYVVAQSKPMMRVDGEISALDSGPVLSPPDVERLIGGLAPPQPAEAAKGAPVEWTSEVAGVGRVRCVTFKDHRGPGLIFRMVSSRSISADHLALSAEIRDLCALTEGLVLVTGPRGSGRSTLLAALVDLINHTRSDHIITIEPQIGFAHESRKSFVSQREVRDDQQVAASVHGAMREDPDVLVVEDVHSADVASALLDAAESGRLVFASVTSSSAPEAVQVFLDLFAENQRLPARASLAASLRAVVSQMLLRKLAGGRTAARELLFNTAAVATLILEGKSAELHAALESGRRHGMLPLTDALASLVREGTVHAAEAYRKAPDRPSLLVALTREGVDTAFAERLA
jgi:twitching motility protein PilT